MSTHLKYEGIQEIVNKLGPARKKQEPSVKEVNQDWRKLASFMRGQK